MLYPYKVWFTEMYGAGEAGTLHSVNVDAVTRETAVAQARLYLNRFTETMGDALIDEEGRLPYWRFAYVQCLDGSYALVDGEWLPLGLVDVHDA